MEEITAKLDAIETSVHAQVHADVDHMVMQCVLYLVQLFLQAEGQGCTIQLDTSQLDDAYVSNKSRTIPMNRLNRFCSCRETPSIHNVSLLFMSRTFFFLLLLVILISLVSIV